MACIKILCKKQRRSEISLLLTCWKMTLTF